MTARLFSFRPATGRFHRPTLHMALILISLACVASVQAAITHCQDGAGRTHYLQFDCPPGTKLVTPDALGEGRLSVVVTTPLTPAEERALDQLHRSLAKARQERARDRGRAARERSARAADDARRCREAIRHLEQLAETRRKGYRATAEAALESEEARWHATRKASC